MPAAPPALVLADEPGPRALRVAAALGAPIAPLRDAHRTSRGVTLVFAFAGLRDLPALILRLVSFHPRALIVAPLGDPGPLPRWNAPIARFCFPSQAAARQWLPHIALGRLVVVEPGPAADESAAILALAAELRSMSTRGGRPR